MTHPDPENAIVTALQELRDLYDHHWHNVNDRRSLHDLAKACDETTSWVRQLLVDAYGSPEKGNPDKREGAFA